MEKFLDFKGQRFLVTGASSGMGEQIAVLLSHLGATVILIARREDNLRRITDSLEGEGHRYYPYDLVDVEGIERLIDKIIDENGPLDGLVHSAGQGVARPLKMSTYHFMLDVMNVNYFSFVEEIRCLMRKGYHNDKFRIVGISSVASLRGNKAQTAYSSSKGAMDAAVRTLAKELGPKGVRINSIVPGWIDTPIGRASLDHGSEERQISSILQKQVLGIGYPSDIAHVTAFLLSDLSSFVTGVSLPVDGGILA